MSYYIHRAQMRNLSTDSQERCQTGLSLGSCYFCIPAVYRVKSASMRYTQLFWKRMAQQSNLLAGAGAGAFVLRIGLESTAVGRLWSIPVAILCLVGGVFAQRAACSLEMLHLLWVYVLWPAASPALATGLAAVVIAALLVRYLPLERLATWIIDVIIGVGALTLYVLTLAPTILPADSGEFQIVGPLLGVAHPPGYAMYTLLARLFSLLPVGEIAWRVNLTGAVTGALTVVIVGRTARRIAGSSWAGIAAATALGVSTTFWAQSTTANIRALTVLFTAWCCDRLIAMLQSVPGSRAARHALLGLALSFGLGVAHHSSLLFFAPVMVIGVLWHDPGILKRPREWASPILVFLMPFALNLYIVIRAITGAPFGADNLTDVQRILDHLSMRGFGGDMFAYLRLDRFLWERFLTVGNMFSFQFGSVLLAVAGAGMLWLIWQKRQVAVLLGGIWATMVFIVATYRAPQSVEYLMPAYVPVALCIGCAVVSGEKLSRKLYWRPFLTALVLVSILALGRANLLSYRLLHQDRSARRYAEAVLNNAPPNAHILTNWHWATPLWYLQLVEGKRPDVTVEYITPQGSTPMPYAWPQIIGRRLAEKKQPLIVTNYYPPYIDLPYRFEPLGDAFLVRDEPNMAIPVEMTRLDVDLSEDVYGGRIRILGYRLYQDTAHPGGNVVVELIWQPSEVLKRDYSFFVHLLGPDGVLLGQQDRRHWAAPGYRAGEVLIDRYDLPIALHVVPGRYTLVAGVYMSFDDGTWQRMTTGSGHDVVHLAEIDIRSNDVPPVTRHPLQCRFVGGPTLIGVDYDDTLAGQRRVYTHWRVNAGQSLAITFWQNGQPIAHAQAPAGQAGYITLATDFPSEADNLALSVDGHSMRGLWGLKREGPISLPHQRGHQHYLPFGGKLALTGVDVQMHRPAGQQARVALSFLSLQPIVEDYVISVNVRGERIAVPPSDWVPALGAIPTFKWIRGSQITDVHLIDLPADAQGQGEVALGIYDAFVNTRALQPLDERFTRLGRPTVPLRIITIN